MAQQGWKFVTLGLGLAAGGLIFARGTAVTWALCLLGLVFTGFCAYFFRDPNRPLPTDSRKIYSPGDGRVLSVAQEGPGDILTLRIFLSIFDVHIQRLPCSGVVSMVRYQPGTFKMAMRADAKINERNIVRIAVEGRKDSVVVDQIAGFIARRIVCRVRDGDRAVAGERYGLIHFGSQVAVHLPPSAKPLVQPGDYVLGGVTEIAQWIDTR
jgi:phosphatidylserine decarboxylase